MRKQIRNTLKLAGAVVGLFGLTNAVQAAPVTYNFTSGSAVLTLTTSSSSLLAPASTVILDGTQVTFDSTALQVNSFQFIDNGPSNLVGAGLFSGTTLTITNLNIVPGLGYSTLAASGTNPYNYLVGPIAVTGTFALSGAITQGPTAFSSVNPSLVGQITLGGVTNLTLSGITLGSFTTPFGAATLKADVIFNGVVPVPAAVWLFGSALGLMGVMRRRAASA